MLCKLLIFEIYLLALLYYDWAAMIPTELTEIWMQQYTPATILYLTARYFNLAYWGTTVLLTFVPGSPLVRHSDIVHVHLIHLLIAVSVIIVSFCRGSHEKFVAARYYSMQPKSWVTLELFH